MDVPYSYEYLNTVEGTQPPAFLKIRNTGLSKFFKKYLIQEALSIVEWTLPHNWDADYFRYSLFGFGSVVVFKTDKFGVIPQNCTYSGYNVFYRPTQAIVSNPLIGSKVLDIGRNCEIVKLMPDYSSIADLVEYYGNIMALTFETMAVNIVNSKLSFVFRARNDREGQTYKALMDKVAAGETCVILKDDRRGMDDISPWEYFSQNLRENYIAPELLDALDAINDQYKTKIGIPTLSTRKKERVNLDESAKNTAEIQCLARLWYDEITAGIKRVKAMFPELTDFSARMRFEELYNDVNNDVNSRAVQLR